MRSSFALKLQQSRIYTTNVISRGIFMSKNVFCVHMLLNENPLGRFRGEGSGEFVRSYYMP